MVQVDTSIFRMYDIRGTVGGASPQLTPGLARLVGKALGEDLPVPGRRFYFVRLARERTPEQLHRLQTLNTAHTLKFHSFNHSRKVVRPSTSGKRSLPVENARGTGNF